MGQTSKSSRHGVILISPAPFVSPKVGAMYFFQGRENSQEKFNWRIWEETWEDDRVSHEVQEFGATEQL